jgi:hypothetical protein
VKALWLLVAVVAGAVVGVGVARLASSSGSSTAISPANPDVQVCPQVIATCNDGTVAPTPCECQGRGGVKRLGVMV